MKRAIAFTLAAFSLVMAVPAQKLELFAYRRDSRDAMRKLVAEFKAEKPEIDITVLFIEEEWDRILKSRAEQGRLSDILLLPSHAPLFEYAGRGYLLDLTKQPALGKVIDAAKSAVTRGGKAWALPLDFAAIGLFYNKDIFAKYKIAPPATYRDLERLCKTLKDGGVPPFAGLLKADWSAGHFLCMIHAGLLAEKKIDPAKFMADMGAGTTSYGLADAKKLLSFLDFYKANMGPNAENMDWAEQLADFASGKAAMMVQGLWSYAPAMAANPKLNLGFVPFPVTNDPKLGKFYADADSCLAVSSQSSPAQTAAALEFVEWLAEAKARKIWIEDCRLASAFKGADLKALGGAWVELLAAVGKNGALPWTFAAYPQPVFERGVKQGAWRYMTGKIKAEEVVAGIDGEWALAAKSRP